jgi:hypothetical protein
MAKKNKTPDIVEEFFATYPNAKEVLKVGDKLMLPIHKKDAELESKTKAIAVETIVNPKFSEKAQADTEKQKQ